MRDFYAEFLERKRIPVQGEEQLPKLPKGPEKVEVLTNGSNGGSLDDKLGEKNADFRLVNVPQEGSNWIHQYNAIDAFHAKLTRIRSAPELAAAFDSLCEERKALMLQNGSSEETAEEYLSSLEFLAWALMSV